MPKPSLWIPPRVAGALLNRLPPSMILCTTTRDVQSTASTMPVTQRMRSTITVDDDGLIDCIENHPTTRDSHIYHGSDDRFVSSNGMESESEWVATSLSITQPHGCPTLSKVAI